ncbi:MAG TPA: DUF4082 domain-containing protein [Vicinamibacteria bacterium]|jgi:hypothetical protein
MKLLTPVLRIAALALVLVAGPSLSFASILGVDIVGGGIGLVNPNDYTLGWGFDLTQSITVTSLGYWDEGGDGFGENHEVGIWAADQTLLASTTVTNASPNVVASTSGFGSWHFQPLASGLQLDAGTYFIGGTHTGPDQFRTLVSDIALGPGIVNFVSGRFEFGGSLQFPAQTESSAFSLYGPNFEYEADAVPEPTTLGLLGLGVMGLAKARRRKA